MLKREERRFVDRAVLFAMFVVLCILITLHGKEVETQGRLQREQLHHIIEILKEGEAE